MATRCSPINRPEALETPLISQTRRDRIPTQAFAASGSSLGMTRRWLIGLTYLSLLLAACGRGDTRASGATTTTPGARRATAGTPSIPSPAPTFGPDTFLEGTVPDVLATDGRFTTILRILSQQDPVLLECKTLPTRCRGTLFAPTDEAFAALPAGTVEAMLDPRNMIEMRTLIASHLLPYVLRSKEFGTGPLEMSNGVTVLQMNVEGTTVTIGRATVVEADIEATNGITHAINRVLGLDLVELE